MTNSIWSQVLQHAHELCLHADMVILRHVFVRNTYPSKEQCAEFQLSAVQHIECG